MPGWIRSRLALGLGGAAIVALSFVLTLRILDRLGGPDEAETEIPRDLRASTVRDLPQFPSPEYDAQWEGIDGLNSRRLVQTATPGNGPTLRFAATADPGLHRAGIRFSGLPTNRWIRGTVWVKAPAGTQLGLEIRDGGQAAGSAPNYGSAQFDLTERKVLATAGNVQAPAIDVRPDDWARISLQIRSADGLYVLYVGLVGSSSTAGARMIFGGVELDPM